MQQGVSATGCKCSGHASPVVCKCSGHASAVGVSAAGCSVLYITEAWPVLGIDGYLLECRHIVF